MPGLCRPPGTQLLCFNHPTATDITLSRDTMAKGLRSKSKKRFRTLRRCGEAAGAHMHACKWVHMHGGRPLTRPCTCAAARPCRQSVVLAPSLIEEEQKKAAAMQFIIDAPRPVPEGGEGGDGAGPSGMDGLQQEGAEEMDERPE